MEVIPKLVNGVRVEFASTVKNEVTKVMLAGIEHLLTREAAPGHLLQVVRMASVADRHSWPSRHVTGNAVDISHVNGRLVGLYDDDRTVRALVGGLQNRFEGYKSRRENFGPRFLKKEGRVVAGGVGDHSDHLHFSVSGPHSQ